MRRLVIAIDFDDVIVDLISIVIKRYNEKFGTNVQLKDYYNPDPTPWQTSALGEASDRFHALTLKHHNELKPLDHAVQVVTKLSGAHELHLVTGRRDGLIDATAKFLDQYMPNCFTSMEFTNLFDKRKRRTKGDVCNQLGVDVLVDDHLSHINDVLSVGLKEVILFGDYPWNQGNLPHGVRRCTSWLEVEKEIQRIAEN